MGLRCPWLFLSALLLGCAQQDTPPRGTLPPFSEVPATIPAPPTPPPTPLDSRAPTSEKPDPSTPE
jgi:hypothetical protein